MDAFTTYIAEQLIDSLELSIEIAKGFTVEEAFVKYGYGS